MTSSLKYLWDTLIYPVAYKQENFVNLMYLFHYNWLHFYIKTLKILDWRVKTQFNQWINQNVLQFITGSLGKFKVYKSFPSPIQSTLFTHPQTILNVSYFVRNFLYRETDLYIRAWSCFRISFVRIFNLFVIYENKYCFYTKGLRLSSIMANAALYSTEISKV